MSNRMIKRILVIGTSGAGKSTFAQRAAERLELPFFASDPFYWEPGWGIATAKQVRQRVGQVVLQEAWVLDGNFDDERELVWKQADCIVWLDYSLATIGRRVVFRNLRWLVTGQPTWSGNRMTLQRAISGIRHAFQSHALKRKNYPAWLAETPSAEIHRFENSREAETWLAGRLT